MLQITLALGTRIQIQNQLQMYSTGSMKGRRQDLRIIFIDAIFITQAYKNLSLFCIIPIYAKQQFSIKLNYP